MMLDLNAIVSAILIVFAALFVGLMADLYCMARWSSFKKSLYTPLSATRISWFPRDVLAFILFYGLLQALFGFGLWTADRLKLVPHDWLRAISLFWATFAVNGIVIAAVLLYLKRRYQVRAADLGLRCGKEAALIGAGVLGYLAFLPPFLLLVFLSALSCALLGIEPKPHDVIEIFQTEKSPWILGGLILFATLIGPLFEEIFFRGFVYGALKKRWGTRGGLVATALLFAAVHFNAFQFLPIFGLGLLLTFLYESTGSLIPSITLHVLNNSISVVLTFTFLRFLQ